MTKKKKKKSHPREKQCLQELSKILKTMITYNASGDRNFYKEDLYNEIQASKLNHYSGKKHIN